MENTIMQQVSAVFGNGTRTPWAFCINREIAATTAQALRKKHAVSGGLDHDVVDFEVDEVLMNTETSRHGE